MKKFVYPQFPAPPAPATPLFPEGFHAFPLIPISIIHNSIEMRVVALIDSGSMTTVFNFDYAQALKIDVEDGILLPQKGIKGEETPLWYHELTLSVNDWEYDCYVGFNNNNTLPVDGLLGYSGFFDRFEVRLRDDKTKGIAIRKLKGRW